jgi:NACalpha-BTF3-like transcription factor
MKRTKIILFGLIVLCVSVIGAFAQKSNSVVKKDLSQADIDRIIKTVTANESEFRAALSNYVFNRNATLQIIGMGGQVAGTYRRDSFLNLTPEGQRFEKIIFAPVATTPPGFVTPEDLEDLGGINPFALDPSVVGQYNFSYLGAEKIDELDLYVFEVTPKMIPNPKKTKQRLFTGRIWVDQQDLQIVKSKGKAVPETKENKFPVVETWRENVDGKYWFPSFASSDDELVFDNGSVTKIKLRVKFENYKQGRSEVRIVDDEEEIKDEPKPTPTPIPAKKP